MAKDIYLALNELYPNTTLENIALKAETNHEMTVENLAKVYDVNITNLNDYGENFDAAALEKYGRGEFFIPEIQETYNDLYTMGSTSLEDALKVGCIVEVTDINDLDRWLEVVQDKPDIVNAFENLRKGSYNHYWAFDNALKMLGVEDGCCAAGEEYCKTPEEYPASYGQSGANTPMYGYRGGR